MIQSYGWPEFVLLALSVRWTVLLTAISFLAGGAFAFWIAIARCGVSLILRRLASTYIGIIQGIPPLILAFLGYYGLTLLGINFPPMVAASLALSIFASGYLADIWRGAIQSVPSQQWQASASLALSRAQQYRYVVLPQAIRISIPPTVGFLVQLVKNTSVLSVVGVVELTRAGQLINNAVFQPFAIFGTVAFFYFLVCFPLSLTSRALERRFSVDRRN